MKIIRRILILNKNIKPMEIIQINDEERLITIEIIIQHKFHRNQVRFFSTKETTSFFIVEYNIPVTVTYQRFQNGVTFQGELSKYYNPTYLFLQISNQRESYDEMHRDLKFVFILNMILHFCCLVCIIIVLIQIKVIFHNQGNFV